MTLEGHQLLLNLQTIVNVGYWQKVLKIEFAHFLPILPGN